ncbi:MAG TPA: zinc ribbon domain-containing protein [Planctomycetota bacterium]|jgi:putative FmdB family regulatory protein|nr:zinc ribbon domain-containing protein [Planctomycetota bacterium]OQC19750.1 MAG: Zinc ribbon domain protein [Planctomycetes bacterium ADurb.Bin069]NMD36396.1 zinc ribbon domain-containing protein [Planctomycetota bacterium]HNR97722.1 zinc ribbon domain-containing protein [Planctomycetota bacterium]HNU24811.1 zinc ribbon domain-containing protein [Planctomycetota bacterium]
MPIFEYKCNACGHCFEELVLGAQESQVVCPKCKNADVAKQISRTGVAGKTGAGSSGCAAPTGSGFS